MAKFLSDKALSLPHKSKKIILVDLPPGVPPHMGVDKITADHIIPEYMRDLGYRKPRFHDLRPWARGPIAFMFLEKDIESMTNFQRIRALSNRRKKLCFVLFGHRANRLRPCIDETKHLVISLRHPGKQPNQKYLPTIKGSRFFTRAATYVDLENTVWYLQS